MLVLTVNAGSSSLKSQLVNTEDGSRLAKCHAERIGSSEARMVIDFMGHKIEEDVENLGVPEVLELLLNEIEGNPASPLESVYQIGAIGNRIVAGGEYFTESTYITRDVLRKIDLCSELAPLHNPPAAACIRLVQLRYPEMDQCAVFDTAFHMSMPETSYLYPISRYYYDHFKIRRYGAHGISHRYASQRVAELLGRPIEELGIISCHLGNGGSVSAIQGGKCIDTSMGLTPLAGIMMGTRSGSIDPAIVTFIMRREGLTPEEMDRILNKKSGLLAVSGVGSDMREVMEAAEVGHQRAKLAIDMYVHSVVKHIGQFLAILNPVDAVVMTAGIGENSIEFRRLVFDKLRHLGLHVDHSRNAKAAGIEMMISTDDSPIKVFVVTTDEEGLIAKETEEALAKAKAKAKARAQA